MPAESQAQRRTTRRRRMVTEDMKQCKACEEIKHVSQFQAMKHYDRPGSPKYWAARCKPCAAEYNRLRLYGATLAEMIQIQGTAVCPLCQIRMADSLDHDHESNAPRGALCRKCNLVMHYVDDKDWMMRAEEYKCRISRGHKQHISTSIERN